MSNYLAEAFKQMDLLTEEDFALTDKGIDELGALLSAEDGENIEVIDADADDVEELEDSYVGKVILDCVVCHSKIYKDAENVVIDEDRDLANVDEECPYCYSVEGYKIVGQIAPFEEKEEADVKVEVEDKDNDGDMDEVSISADNDELEEGCDKEDTLKEELEKVEIETDDSVITVSEEPKEECEECAQEEVIAPLDVENKEEIVSTTNDVEDFESDVQDSMDDEFVDQDFEEFDEEEFNELGESYLKKVYDNVKSFQTSNVSTKGNTLKLEGIITFASGNKKATTFLFEAHDITKRGKVRFIGENCQISRGKKAFTLTGSIKGNKLIAESLNYNYRTKDANGKSVRLYGTVKR